MADMGVRDQSTHSWQPPPGLFTADDFFPGAELQLAHAPGQTFILMRGDGFTQSYLAARDAQGGQAPARDVYVPDNKAPVPSLPLEGDSGSPPTPGGSSLGDEVDKLVPPAVQQSCLVLAKVLAGVMASAQNVVRQSDRNDRGFAPKAVMAQVLARYGCREPACSPHIVDDVLSAFVIGTGAECLARERAIENARSTKHAMYRPTTPAADAARSARQALVPAGSPQSSRSPNLSDESPLRGPELVDFLSARFADEPMVDYAKVFAAVRAVAERQQVLQPRLDKLISQLRTAMLSSRLHLRRIFRDLDVAGNGTVTFSEMRNLLLRHHLDIGMNDAQVRALMARFPPAPGGLAVDAHGEPCISWRGFVETILGAQTLAPGEIDGILDFVRGVHDNEAANGVGGTRVWPEVYPHVNQVSSWGADMNLAAFGVRAGRPATAAAAPAAPAAGPPPPEPQRAGFPKHEPRPASTSAAAPVVALLGAPELPASRPRTAPAGVADPRPAPERALLDVVEALSTSAKGVEVLRRMRSTFGQRRLELFKALSLFDTQHKRSLTAESFVNAVVSAGLRLTVVQKAELVKEVCRLAGGSTGLVPPPNDVHLDYGKFIDTLFEE
jgi:hypothetical protein